MSKLSTRKSRLCVEFSDTIPERGQWREVVMELHPHYLAVRLKGLRKSYPISPGAVYERAAQLEAMRMRAERDARRKAKRHT